MEMKNYNRIRIDEKHKEAKRLIGRVLKDVQGKYPNIVLDEIPTKTILIIHSCVRSQAIYPHLLKKFYAIEPSCSFYVFPAQYPHYKEYIFAELESVDSAKILFDTINGKKPDLMGSSKIPFHCLYASNFDLTNEEVNLPGFNLFPNAISDDESKELNDFVMNSCKPSELLKNRTVIHFGHTFDYGTNTATIPTAPIPPILINLIDKLKADGIPIQIEPDQVTINIYEISQGIPSHVDTHSAFEEQIVVVSLLSDIVIKFKDCANNATVIDKLMSSNSVLVMESTARYKYRHGILTRRYDISPLNNKLIERKRRISITFRKIRTKPCECPFPEFCDWDRNGLLAFPKEDKEASRLENKYVSQVYENIADHFDYTRNSLWSAFVTFLNSLPEWSLVFDAGCGNGKYLVSDFKLVRIGSDICANLAKISAQKGGCVFRANLLELPVLDNSFDAVICSAVVHHFSTEERRLRAFKEIARVLRAGGRALVSGWSKEQGDSFYQKMRANRIEDDEVDELVIPTNKLVVHDGQIFKQQDMLVPWDSSKKFGGQQFLRYYHLFVEGEMDQIVEKLEGCKKIQSFHEQGNWFIEFEKC